MKEEVQTKKKTQKKTKTSKKKVKETEVPRYSLEVLKVRRGQVTKSTEKYESNSIENIFDVLMYLLEVLGSSRINKFRPEIFVSRTEGGDVMLAFNMYRHTFGDIHLFIIKEKVSNEWKIMKCPKKLIPSVLDLEFPGVGNKVVYPKNEKENLVRPLTEIEKAIMSGNAQDIGLDDLL